MMDGQFLSDTFNITIVLVSVLANSDVQSCEQCQLFCSSIALTLTLTTTSKAMLSPKGVVVFSLMCLSIDVLV